MPDEYLFDIFSPAQLAELEAGVERGRKHPLLALRNREGYVYANTNRAILDIRRQNEQWLADIVPRMLDKDYPNAAAALGEVRAYGFILETGLHVTPEPVVQGKRVRPDFAVDAGDGQAIVEVHTRQMSTAEADDLAKHTRNFLEAFERMPADRPGGKAYFAPATTVTPFGAPEAGKPGDTVSNNAISRLAATKTHEHQHDETKPYILWHDLQDLTAFALPVADEQLSPMYSDRDGAVATGALWYAQYGAKGDPQIAMRGPLYQVSEMLHDGKFLQSSRVSAVVYSLHNTTVLMEHPSPALSISPNLRAYLLRLPWFSLDRSYQNWAQGLVGERVALDKRVVQITCDALVSFNSLWDVADEPPEPFAT